MDKHAYVIIVSAKHSGHLKASDLRLNGSWCTATPKEVHVNECDFLTFSLIYPLKLPPKGLGNSLTFQFLLFFLRKLLCLILRSIQT